MRSQDTSGRGQQDRQAPSRPQPVAKLLSAPGWDDLVPASLSGLSTVLDSCLGLPGSDECCPNGLDMG